MAKREKVKSKAKPPPPPSNISSSDLSDSSSDDESSDEEIDNITKNLDPKTKLFISKLMEDLESVQAKVATRDDDLIAQENIYIASKEALALERSEVASLRKALTKEQEDHALTKKANIALNQKYCGLDEKHKVLELQYSLLWDSTSHPSKAKDAYTPSTSQGHGKCFNLDLNIYATNLANMETMRKEIARLKEMIAGGCMDDLTKSGGKKIEKPKGPQYKNGWHPLIKDELRHTKGAKTNGKKLSNGFGCV
jgi:chromosome segregation ATPase